jgi:hypothetical protein
MLFMGSTALVEDVLFEDNDSTGGGNGGAITTTADSKVNIRESRFFKNSAIGSGGAIYNVGELNVTRSLFRGNSVATSGGAVFGVTSKTMRIDQCDFESNSAVVTGSAISFASNLAGLSITDSAFFSNKIATVDRGVVHVDSFAGIDINVANSCLCNNSAGDNEGPSFSCGSSAGKLLVGASTLAGVANKCPTADFRPSACASACERRVPYLQTTRTTTTATTSAETLVLLPATQASSITSSGSISATTSAMSTLAEPEGLDAGTLGAIIGGSVGGLLVIIGVIVLIVMMRKRKRNPGAPHQKPPSVGEYGAIELAKSHYGDASDVRAQAQSEAHYGQSAMANLN